MNKLGMVFRREGSKLPLYGGCKVGCEKFFFPPKLTFLEEINKEKPFPSELLLSNP